MSREEGGARRWPSVPAAAAAAGACVDESERAEAADGVGEVSLWRLCLWGVSE